MKLYCTPGGQWSGTEKDWKAQLKAEGIEPKNYTGRRQIDIPTDKAGLMEFLTFYNVNVTGAGFVAGAEIPAAAAPLPAAAGVDLAAMQAMFDPNAIPPAPDRQIIEVPDTQVISIDEMFRAAPIPKQVELAVGLLDRLEIAVR